MFNLLRSLLPIVLLVGAPTAGFAKADLKALDQATAFARSPKVTKLNVEKSVVSDLLKKETKATGTIFVRKNRFRWDVEGAEKSQLIFDGKVLWAAVFPTAGFDDPVQVTKTKIDRKRDDQVLLRLLTGDLVPSKSFSLTNKTSDAGVDSYAITAKNKDIAVKDLIVKIKKGNLQSLSYRDDLNNLTTLSVQNKTTEKSPAKDLFDFKIPKGAEVNQ